MAFRVLDLTENTVWLVIMLSKRFISGTYAVLRVYFIIWIYGSIL